MTISILGQDYDFQEIAQKNDPRLANCDGYTDNSTKVIRVNNDFNENDPASIGDLSVFKKKVMRHEIIHAFFVESGLKNYNEDELIVDWIALQFPKLLKTFTQVEAL